MINEQGKAGVIGLEAVLVRGADLIRAAMTEALEVLGEICLASAPSALAHAAWPRLPGGSVSGSRLGEHKHDLAQEHHASKLKACSRADEPVRPCQDQPLRLRGRRFN